MKTVVNALFGLLILTMNQSSLAVPVAFTNGNFDAGLNGWDIDGNTSLNGSGQVELSTIGPGGVFADASLTQGDFFVGDSIQLGATDNFLNFDVMFQDLGAGGASGSALTDGLLVSILDEFGFGPTDLFFDSAFDFAVGSTFTTVSLDISSLAGQSIGLFFDVFDEDDGRNSLFKLDNISFSETSLATTVPEPSILFLLVPGMLFFAKRYKNQSNSSMHLHSAADKIY